MDKKSVEWLKANGYEEYSTASFEKWQKIIEDSEGNIYALRIRTTTPHERANYGDHKYCGKAKLPADISKTDIPASFACFYEDDVAELDRLMKDDVAKYI